MTDRAAAIERRRTDRLPMNPPHRFGEFVHTVRMLTTPHDVEVDVLDDSAGPLLAAASERAAAARHYDMDCQTELHWWTGHSFTTEGVPRTALVSDAEAARGTDRPQLSFRPVLAAARRARGPGAAAGAQFHREHCRGLAAHR